MSIRLGSDEQTLRTGLADVIRLSICLVCGVVVGRGGLEPPTSRLSGVRSNHLSYRPTSRFRLPVPGPPVEGRDAKCRSARRRGATVTTS